MLDQRIKERIAAEEAARFMDGSFGQLDLSGFPCISPILKQRHSNCRTDMDSTEWTTQDLRVLTS